MNPSPPLESPWPGGDQNILWQHDAGSATGPVRSVNEDAVHTQEGLAILADGMGGHAAGEVASSLAVSILSSQLGGSSWPVAQHIVDAFESANQALLSTAAQNPGLRGMGTTAVLLKWHGCRAWVAHCGDSRAYLWRKGCLIPLTVDHSLAQRVTEDESLRAWYGHLSPRQMRGQLVRALGCLDLWQPDLQELAVEPGDCFLLCSDGITDVLDDEALVAWLAGPGLADVRSLIRAAIAAGTTDNVSAILVRATPDHGPG